MGLATRSNTLKGSHHSIIKFIKGEFYGILAVHDDLRWNPTPKF